jgi:hypothetical protein
VVYLRKEANILFFRVGVKQMSINDLRKEISNIINDVDPMDLLSGGAPSDEYEVEIEKIIQQMHSVANDEKELAELIQEVFEESFGELTGTNAKYKEAASKILKKLQCWRENF